MEHSTGQSRPPYPNAFKCASPPGPHEPICPTPPGGREGDSPTPGTGHITTLASSIVRQTGTFRPARLELGKNGPGLTVETGPPRQRGQFVPGRRAVGWPG